MSESHSGWRGFLRYSVLAAGAVAAPADGIGASRKMPVKSASYWSGSYTDTYTRTHLAYYYQNETLPVTLPARAAGADGMVLQAEGNSNMPAPPAVGTFRLSRPRVTSVSTFSAAGALQVTLGERSLSVRLPSGLDHSQVIARIAGGSAAAIRGSALKYKSVHVVLDDITITAEGANGGYFFNLYLNVPASRATSSARRTSLIGNLGPFQVRAAAQRHGGRAKLRYVVTQLLADVPIVDIGMATVSFVRVNGEHSPAGPVIEIGEMRLELSTDEDES